MTLAYYDILGIDRNATRKEIQHAYWTKARLYHPDRQLQKKSNHFPYDHQETTVENLSNVNGNDGGSYRYQKNTTTTTSSKRGEEIDGQLNNNHKNLVNNNEDTSRIKGLIDSSTSDNNETGTFWMIQEAYEVLIDDNAKEKYDRHLQQEENALEYLIGESIDFNDMDDMDDMDDIDDEEFAKTEDTYHGRRETRSYPCRCGEIYVLSRIILLPLTEGKMVSKRQQSVNDSQIPEVRILPCSGCSLHLKVFIFPE